MNAPEVALTRAGLYKLFSLGLSYPAADLREEIAGGTYQEEIRNLWSGTRLEELAWPQPCPASDLETDYIQLFEQGRGEPPCPLYSGIYQKEKERPLVLWEIKAFYRAFGLQEAPRPHELPDHLGMELEFMYFLSFQEAGVPEEEQGALRLAQRDFLSRHLLPGLQGLGQRMASKHTHPFYAPLANLAREYCFRELARLEEVLPPDSGQPLLQDQDLPEEEEVLSLDGGEVSR